ncbi:hypothetical protein [Paenibacillus herberti]|uniref:hypothetical protein n=1 Tax=Paenibacillus herberti TaxID=1619309 RepID=UPI001595EDBA|nr:hypothetical protein [Paenibacillus herberti]
MGKTSGASKIFTEYEMKQLELNRNVQHVTDKAITYAPAFKLARARGIVGITPPWSLSLVITLPIGISVMKVKILITSFQIILRQDLITHRRLDRMGVLVQTALTVNRSRLFANRYAIEQAHLFSRLGRDGDRNSRF